MARRFAPRIYDLAGWQLMRRDVGQTLPEQTRPPLRLRLLRYFSFLPVLPRDQRRRRVCFADGLTSRDEPERRERAGLLDIFARMDEVGGALASSTSSRELTNPEARWLPRHLRANGRTRRRVGCFDIFARMNEPGGALVASTFDIFARMDEPGGALVSSTSSREWTNPETRWSPRHPRANGRTRRRNGSLDIFARRANPEARWFSLHLRANGRTRRCAADIGTFSRINEEQRCAVSV